MHTRILILFIAALGLSGCFEIVEEVDLNTDGSGRYSYTLNLSQSRTNLDRIMLLDSVNGYKVPHHAEIDRAIEVFKNSAGSVEGIEEIKHTADHDNYIYSFSVSFKNVTALNKLIASVRKNNNDPLQQIPDVHFTYDEKTKRYVRNGKYPVKDEFLKLKKADKVVFDGAKFTSIFRCENEITHCSNERARIAPSKKALLLQFAVIDLINEQENMGHTIQLTP